MAWTNDRARVAALSRSRPADDPDLVNARQRLKAARAVARAEDYVRKLITEAPALTEEQRSQLTLLLRDPSQPGGAPPGRRIGPRGTAVPPNAVSTERGGAHALGGDAA